MLRYGHHYKVMILTQMNPKVHLVIIIKNQEIAISIQI